MTHYPEKFKNIRFTYVRQKSQKGLGDAIAQASHLVNDSAFAILLADDLIFSETSCLQQLIDIYKNTSASVIGINEVPKSDVSKSVGKKIAEEAKTKGISKVVFDRNGYLYHGRVKALADAARESGLQF